MKPALHLKVPALDGSRFVVEVFSELQQRTIQSRWHAINILLRLSMLTGSQMQIDSALDLLCDYAQEIAGFEIALIYLWNEKEDRYGLRVSRKCGPQQVRKASAARNQSQENENNKEGDPGGDTNIFSHWVTQYSQPLIVRQGESTAADACFHKVGATSCLVVPLFMNNRVMGSLQLFSRAHNAFSTEDAQLLWILALIAENLLTREAANEGLMRFAFTDYLTGLRTRGYFEQQLELEIRRTDRRHTKFALMMLDIDYFKCFNDTFGHHVGDQVLREVSSILMRDMREVDTVARYGGEEFAIILPETDLHGALQVAERLRHSVEQTTFYAGSPPTQQQLTMSIGIALFGDQGHHRNEIIEAADSALYQAKARGRNCIVIYSDFSEQAQTS
jgi:diguanylate cyclase (GGDEF)-like protein